MFTFFYHVEILSRVQLLFVLIPISIGISLMKSIANNSDRNFKQDYSKGIVTNFIRKYDLPDSAIQILKKKKKLTNYFKVLYIFK